MKTSRRLFTTIFLLCLAGIAMAQDVIVMKDQSTVMSKVLEITSTEIKYKKWNNQDGPIYSINRSEVLCINYQNGEVEQFSENTSKDQNTYSYQVQKRNRGYMEEIASFPAAMKLDGRRLTHEEVHNLVDEKTYQLYLKGKRQVNIGEIVGITGLGVGIVASVCLRLAIEDRSYLTSGLILGAGSLGSIIGGVIVSINGATKMHNVAEAYNNGQKENISFNISPTMMKCETPQSQDNCALGLTLSMNF